MLNAPERLLYFSVLSFASVLCIFCSGPLWDTVRRRFTAHLLYLSTPPSAQGTIYWAVVMDNSTSFIDSCLYESLKYLYR